MTAPTQSDLSAKDIVDAYDIVLGRAPESDIVVTQHRAAHPDHASLYRSLLASPEFRMRFSASALHEALHEVMFAPPLQVEHEVAPDVMRRMMGRVRDQWTALGRTEPHWSVLTADRFRAASLSDPENLAFFRATGLREASLVDVFSDRTGVRPAPGVCLELGCGVGRVTRHLADRFARVIGLDVSPGNLAQCEAYMAEAGVENVEARLIMDLEDFDKLPEIDFFYSIISLQHNPPPLQKDMLRRVMTALRPGGVMLFQVLGENVGYVFDAESYLASHAPQMEMHCLPRALVLAEMAAQGVRPLDVVADARTAALVGSTTFYAVKT